MERRDFLRTVVGSIPAAAWPRISLGAQQEQEGKAPNVIFILADDLGWGDLGCYGHRDIKTPNLDRLARQGTLFTQFYVNSGVCSPSRTAFMTSHYPARHRVHGHFADHRRNQQRGMPNWLDPSVATLTRLLQGAGYATAHYGKWHLGSGEGAPSPSAYGIDGHRTLNSNGPGWKDARDPYFRARSTGLIVDEAIRFMRNNRDKPFYINAWTLVPHATLHPMEEHMAPYRRFGPANVPYKGAMQIYYASVTDLDRQIGRLLDELDDLGLAENTLVFFSSDNGPEDIHIRNASHSGVGSPGPLRGRKRSLYEGGVRTPCLVRWPQGVPAGSVDDTSVLTGVDFLPTVCKLAGVELPAELQPDGEDVSDVLAGRPRTRTKPIMWEWRFAIAGHVWNGSPMLAIRDGDWKLLMNPDRSRVELYDILRDPSEQNNVADRHPEVVVALSKQLLVWQKDLPEGPVSPEAGRNDYPWPGPGKVSPVSGSRGFD